MAGSGGETRYSRTCMALWMRTGYIVNGGSHGWRTRYSEMQSRGRRYRIYVEMQGSGGEKQI
ncbi:unnamed protein product [Staurois parvus]|uniref:Uncharacterized protein n=1 Tax=Staurois parvus TaxID=386267 RepID=A0ABN9GGZ9_9NEOB|nr:unnamed protein product [Staurois parvus]